MESEKYDFVLQVWYFFKLANLKKKLVLCLTVHTCGTRVTRLGHNDLLSPQVQDQPGKFSETPPPPSQTNRLNCWWLLNEMKYLMHLALVILYSNWSVNALEIIPAVGRQKQTDHYEFKARLVQIENSMPARAT